MSVLIQLQQFSMEDATARDLTRINETLHTSGTSNVGAIDNQTTSIVFASVTGMAVGSQVYNSVTGEHVTITALPASAGGPCTVARGNCGDTAIPAYPSSAAATHADGEQWYVLRFGGLIDMGMSGAQSVTAAYIQQLGSNSETLADAEAALAQAQSALSSTLAGIVQPASD